MQGWEQRVGRRREAEKGGGLRQAGVGVKEAESWGGVTEGMRPGGLGMRKGRSLGSPQPPCLGLLSASLPHGSQGTSLFFLPPFILLSQLHPPAPLSGLRNIPGWLFQLHQPALGSGLGTGSWKPPGPSFPSPLPSAIGTRCSCSWSGCTPAQVVPRRARSKGRRPGWWPPGLGEGSSLSMGLVVALGSAGLSNPACFPDWTELFTISRSSTGLADKGEAAE